MTLNMLGVGTYQVTVTDDNNCEAVGSVLLVDDEEPVLIRQARIFPNPAGDQAWLELDLSKTHDLDIELLDWMGRRVRYFRWEHQTGVIPISLEGLAAGLYVVRVRAGVEAVFTGRLVRGDGRW